MAFKEICLVIFEAMGMSDGTMIDSGKIQIISSLRGQGYFVTAIDTIRRAVSTRGQGQYDLQSVLDVWMLFIGARPTGAIGDRFRVAVEMNNQYLFNVLSEWVASGLFDDSIRQCVAYISKVIALLTVSQLHVN